jgi:hypothetical protein
MVRSGGGGTATDPSSTIPSGWTCVGSCGTDGADGVVTLSPIGSSHYEWVSTAGGSNGVGALPTGALGSETDGSTLATQVFTATAGTSLNFYFNYVTSDGAGYADYAWAELFNSANTPVALLFTARTVASGTIVPGTGMPTPPGNPDSRLGAHHRRSADMGAARYIFGFLLRHRLRLYRLGQLQLRDSGRWQLLS